MKMLLRPANPPRSTLLLLAGAALCVGVAGYEHARLFYSGYDHVSVVGPLFLLNAIASTVTILLLVARRVTLFVIATALVCGGSLVSILISHNASFFGFSESGYTPAATVIVVAEAAAIVLAMIASAAGMIGRQPHPAS